MKKITLEKIYRSLVEMRYVIQVPEAVAEKARKSILAMLSVPAGA